MFNQPLLSPTKREEWGGVVAELPSDTGRDGSDFLRGDTVGSGPARLQKMGNKGTISPYWLRRPVGQGQLHSLGGQTEGTFGQFRYL